MWEKDVCHLWRTMGRKYPDWEDAQYLRHFRMSKDTFWFLSQTYGKYLERQDSTEACNTCCQETSHCFALTSPCP